MIRRMHGMTMLEVVVTTTVTGLAATAAISRLDGWTQQSEQHSVYFAAQVASSSMQTHRIWAQAAGKDMPQWQDVVSIEGMDYETDQNGNLTLRSGEHNACYRLDREGTVSDCRGGS